MRLPLAIPLAIGALLAGVMSARAQTPSPPATASIGVQNSLNVATIRPMRFQTRDGRTSLSVTASGLADAPAMIQISGDPGRIYRIRVPRIVTATGDTALIEDLRVLSQNSGDISETRVGRLDGEGQDLLRITGQLRILRSSDGTDTVAALPLSIDYE